MTIQNRDYFWIFIISVISLNICDCAEINRDVLKIRADHYFDVLIFTQRWPITDCITWMSHGSDHVCTLPSQKDTWIIHGVWPTKFGTLGPFFCNNSEPFDINTLNPLKDQLRQYWTNIRKGTPEESLWEHEWDKHGTCASILEPLKSENKYFGQGLAWLQQFTMNGLLSKAGLEPGNQYSVSEFHNAIKNELNVNPVIECVKEKQYNREQYLSEMRICFNKQLELVDCDGVVGALPELSEHLYSYSYPNSDNIITSCSRNQPIHYPSTLPAHIIAGSKDETIKPVWRFPWVNLYKLVQIIKWFTL